MNSPDAPGRPPRPPATGGGLTRRPRSALRKRAMSEVHKQQRRQAMLDAALGLLEVMPYGAITMQLLAEHLGLVKGTLYLYFATKEALFLALQEQQLRAWFDDLHATLAAHATLGRLVEQPPTPDELALILVESIGRHRQFPRLLSLLHSVLECNISLAEAIAFKQLLRVQVARVGAAIEAALPRLHPGQGTDVLLRLHALVIGTWLLTDPSPVVRVALADPAADLAVFELRFAPFLTSALAALLSGMTA